MTLVQGHRPELMVNWHLVYHYLIIYNLLCENSKWRTTYLRNYNYLSKYVGPTRNLSWGGSCIHGQSDKNLQLTIEYQIKNNVRRKTGNYTCVKVSNAFYCLCGGTSRP